MVKAQIVKLQVRGLHMGKTTEINGPRDLEDIQVLHFGQFHMVSI